MARSKREGSTLGRRAAAGMGRPGADRAEPQAAQASASHVAIIGHITPREFRLRLAEADMTGGTYNRYLPLFVERSRLLPIPEGVSDDVGYLGARLAAAIDQAADGRADPARPGSHPAVDRRAVPGADRRRRRGPRRGRVHPPGRAVLPAHRRAARRPRRPPAHRKADLTAAAALVRYTIASARYVLDGRPATRGSTGSAAPSTPPATPA